MRISLVVVLFAAILMIREAPLFAQASQTISHQGKLTDNLGDPVPDASRDMTFRLYDEASGGTELWGETQSVATTGGYFAVELGSVTSFDGFNFNQPLWLGITISGDNELSPRTPITSVPTAMGLVHPYKAVVDTFLAGFWMENEGSGDAILAHNRGSGTAGAFIVSDPTEASVASGVFAQNNAKGPAIFGQHIGTGGEAGRFQITDPGNTAPALSISNEGTGPGLYASSNAVFETADLSPTGAEGANEDISIYASDAQIGLYSNAGGVAGSGLQLGEMGGGSLINKWSMFRSTTGDGGAFNFTWGTNPAYSNNPTVVRFDTTGDVTASNYKYADPKVSYYSFGSESFAAYDGWNSFDGYPFSGGPQSLREGVHLPHGATIKSVSCIVIDNSDTRDISCGLYYRQGSGGITYPVATLETSNTPGTTTLSTNISHLVDNNQRSYYVIVDANNWGTLSGAIRFKNYTIEYEMAETL